MLKRMESLLIRILKSLGLNDFGFGRMVKKLTARYMSLNRQFKVQRHTIVCQSGMEDYVSVTIDHTESFSFDFWTKELTCEYGSRYFEDVSEVFRKMYGNITIVNDSK